MAIRHAARRPISLEEFLAMPETEPASELINGEVVQKPVPKIPHSWAVRNLIIALARSEFASRGVWLTEQGINFPGDPRANHRVPDLSWFAPGRISLSMQTYPDFPPDLAVEVRSDGQSLNELREKLQFFRDAGSAATLLIDPLRRSAELFEGGKQTVAEGDATLVVTSLGGFELSLSSLFSE